MYDVIPVTTTHYTACGPACLKMILGYYGIDVPLDTLTEECGVKVNGCSAADLLRVGRAHGLDDFGSWQEMPADVLKQDRPAIIWWQYTHFIVFCGTDEAGDVWICNPSQGRYRIDAGTFAAKCSGLQAGTCVALCNGRPEDARRVADKNIVEGELFEASGETCVALRPITRGETLTAGWNYNPITIIEALNNAQRED